MIITLEIYDNITLVTGIHLRFYLDYSKRIFNTNNNSSNLLRSKSNQGIDVLD